MNHESAVGSPLEVEVSVLPCKVMEAFDMKKTSTGVDEKVK